MTGERGAEGRKTTLHLPIWLRPPTKTRKTRRLRLSEVIAEERAIVKAGTGFRTLLEDAMRAWIPERPAPWLVGSKGVLRKDTVACIVCGLMYRAGFVKSGSQLLEQPLAMVVHLEDSVFEIIW